MWREERQSLSQALQVPSSMVAFTGYDDKIKEEQWMRMEQTTKAEWIPVRIRLRC